MLHFQKIQEIQDTFEKIQDFTGQPQKYRILQDITFPVIKTFSEFIGKFCIRLISEHFSFNQQAGSSRTC